MAMAEYDAQTLPFTHEPHLTVRERYQTLKERVPSPTKRRLAAAAMVMLPFLGAAAAVNHSPDKTIDVAGAPIRVSSEIGQNYTSLRLTNDTSNELLVQDHASVLDKPIGVTANIDKDNITYGFLEEVANDPAPLADRVEESAKAYFIERSVEGAAGVLILEIGTIALLMYGGQKLRRNSLVAAAACATAITIVGGGSLMNSDHHTVDGNSLLAGTPLKNVEVSVQPQVIDYIMHQVSDTEDSKAYEMAAEQTRTLLESYPQLHEDGWSTIVVIDDPQGNKLMARVAGVAANTLDAAVIVSGDTTNFASHSEAVYILDTIRHYANENGKDTSEILTAGPHDTDYIVDYAKKLGYIIPDGESVMVNGISILGFNDPRESNISLLRDGYTLRNPDQSVEQFSEYVKDKTCKQQPYAVVAHDSDLLKSVQESGCARLIIGGRTFDSTRATVYTTPTLANESQTASIRLGSGGGHKTTKVFTKTAEGPAQLTILQVNPETGESRYVVETVLPNGQASISSLEPLIKPDEILTAQPISDNGKITRANALNKR